MGSLIKYVARWLVWQVGEHSAVAEPGQARITFFSADERLSARSRGALEVLELAAAGQIGQRLMLELAYGVG